MKIAFSRRLRIFIIALAVLLLPPASYFGVYMQVQGNFHPITAGEAYRSAKLDRDKLEYYVKKYNIKSIVNLLGEDPRKAWYREEIQVSAEHKIKHYDISLSATREPTEEDARQLVEIFQNAPRPVLIHCKGGSDRSGLVAAMWKVVVDKEPKSEARKQLSILYGHFPFNETSAMDHFFEHWDPALQPQ
ncbi:MAG: dual specificity protein phosphatase family protein [Desulfobacterales bacterium]|nr:dual specificity protein phosphatase family protein [Desulfobacterales bacterium]